MSSEPASYEARRAELVARAATYRENISRQLAPLASLERGLEQFESIRAKLTGISIGGGLGLSALLLGLRGSRTKIVRIGLALTNLAGSVKRLVARS